MSLCLGTVATVRMLFEYSKTVICFMSANQPIAKSKHLLIERLQGKIRRAETLSRNDDGTIVSSGSAAMDQMLPAGGYKRGTIVEWLADPGSGADFLSMLAAKHAASEGGALVVVDSDNQFYPPAARSMGINLSNLIVLREKGSGNNGGAGVAQGALNHDDFYWSIDQSLRCPAVAAVWGCLPGFETPAIATRWLRRFQLSAEASGCLGLFVKPMATLSWSEVQWQIQPRLTRGNARCVKATLSRCRGGTVGRSVELEINTVTGNVQTARREHATRITRDQSQQQTIGTRPKSPLPLAAQLADPETGRRSA